MSDALQIGTSYHHCCQCFHPPSSTNLCFSLCVFYNMYQKISSHLILLLELDAVRLQIWFPVGLKVNLLCVQCGLDRCKKKKFLLFLHWLITWFLLLKFYLHMSQCIWTNNERGQIISLILSVWWKQKSYHWVLILKNNHFGRGGNTKEKRWLDLREAVKNVLADFFR